MKSLGVKQLAWMLLLAMLAALALSTRLDGYADSQYQQTFQRALVTFGLARALNGVISVAQGTELALEPAGIGVTFAPGELLDPVNDLIERFSWVMLLSSVSLGVQQTLLTISSWWPIRVFLAASAVGLIVVSRLPNVAPSWRRGFGRLVILALLLRFSMPIVVLLNDAIYQRFMQADYIAATQAIEQTQSELELITEQDESVETGVLDSLRNWVDQTAAQIDLKRRVEQLRAKLATTTEQLLRLAALFVLQTVVLPVATLWILIKGSAFLTRSWLSTRSVVTQ